MAKKRRTATGGSKTTTTAAWMAAVAAAAALSSVVPVVRSSSSSSSSSSSGFPGTIRPPPRYPPAASPSGDGAIHNDNDDEAGESSSDWDDALIMEEDPLAFAVTVSTADRNTDAEGGIHSSHSSDQEEEEIEIESGGEMIDSDSKTAAVANTPEEEEEEAAGGNEEQPPPNDDDDEEVQPKPEGSSSSSSSSVRMNLMIAPPPPPPPRTAPSGPEDKDETGGTATPPPSREEEGLFRHKAEEEEEPFRGEERPRDERRRKEDRPQRRVEGDAAAADPPETPRTVSSTTAQQPRQRPANAGRHPSNQKPLKTLEKLQQLLDDTDYLTSSSSTSAPGTGIGADDPPRPQHEQQQHANPSSKKSYIPGINSLWTSKDRTKYKKQQRLQKEQMRLKHQQEEQLRNQQHQAQKSSLPITESEDFSDTDDGLGYTLPNLPVYLSDGEEDAVEAMFMSDQTGSSRMPPATDYSSWSSAASSSASASASSSSPSLSSTASRLLAASQKQQKQQQQQQQQQEQQQWQLLTYAQQREYLQQEYLQHQRDLSFFAQDRQQQQQQQQQQQPPPPPTNPLQYPNQQEQEQQQHPYYEAGLYPPPPHPGLYYGLPPQYYNRSPLPHPPQYNPYYPYRGLPTIAPTVPRNPRQKPSSLPSFGSGAESRSQTVQQQQGDEESSSASSLAEDPGKPPDGSTTIGDESASPQGVVMYPPPPSFDASYYPQTPEQQEQWHLEQLRILQAREKYERDLRRKRQAALLVAAIRSASVAAWKTLQSCRKVSTCAALSAAACYAAVSPRNLPYLECNRMFYENLQRAALVVLPSLIGYGWLAVDWNQLRVQLGGGTTPQPASEPRESLPEAQTAAVEGEQDPAGATATTAADKGSLAEALHVLIHSCYTSFVFGYIGVFALEILWTTVLRLAIFLAWEPDMFGVKLPWSSTPAEAFSAPSKPLPSVFILPWILRECNLRPKRITLLAADILTSCVACPIVEEFAKLRLLQWTVPLSKNFAWVEKVSKNGKSKKLIAEPITPDAAGGDDDDEEKSGGATRRRRSLDGTVTNINTYIAGMLAVSLGLKWADAIRRVCMYTKVRDEQKSVYAVLRGIFPVQELCGIMTALGLARRDVLGQKVRLWKLLLPATIVHAMANLRGTKPIFKWNSSTPWAEMQISPDVAPGLFSAEALAEAVEHGLELPTTKLGWLSKAFPKIMWIVILIRAAGYCAKNYFMINRQAERRATIYAGKHAAFSAELETAQQLKNAKDQYKYDE